MAQKYLGETIDIHMGGKDLIFPHHENEIAQAEAITGKTFVRYWLHNEWLTVGGEKMSKSLGNFVTVRDALKMCSPEVLRFFLVSAHYRSPLDFNDEAIKNAERRLERLMNALRRLNDLPEREDESAEDRRLILEIEDGKRRFEESMDDDFNTPLAISALMGMAKAINSYADVNEKIEGGIKRRIQCIFTDLLEVLGVKWEAEMEASIHNRLLKDVISVLVDVRDELRRRMDWEIADRIRDRLRSIGIILEDTPKGTKWRISRK